jgi:hypothetical protein
MVFLPYDLSCENTKAVYTILLQSHLKRENHLWLDVQRQYADIDQPPQPQLAQYVVNAVVTVVAITHHTPR